MRGTTILCDLRRLFEVADTFTILIDKMVSPVYTYIKTYQIVHFKHLSLIVCQFEP